MTTQMNLRPFGSVAANLSSRGWSSDTAKDIVFYNPSKGMFVHVAVCDGDRPLYDQPIFIEPVGAKTIPMNSKNELGLVKVFRVVHKDPESYDYQAIVDKILAGEPDLSDFGYWSWEFPRGLPNKPVKGIVTPESAQSTAMRETAEEIGSPLLESQYLGATSWNTTFASTRQSVWVGKIDEEFKGEIPPDINEKILQVEWFDREQIYRMMVAGDMFCDMSMSALSLLEAHERIGALFPSKRYF